ncbi:heparinase II/III domain-containing protein [Pseudoroseicyclus aestuarii]|uniref:Heparinase II/III-like protein n=1 Tax=Pseudoroseicyclus aestuarii TaxID=1795041 RepID=A0A318T0U3_9RHOB|nr:heparinase II/III family protein [Pseudoroseicyclus aestuarii]PYE86259.1 heparinase II/III-like protein [Pseudoroseicyclus aestuarii]
MAFAAYVRQGDREDFEARYFARRRKLNALVMAELARGDGRYLDAIADGLWLICEESGWQLPAHNAQARGGRRAPLPDPADPVLDLFAAETGGLVAVLLSLLGERLEEHLPGLRARAEAEIERRILTPYMTRDYWWMGGVDGPTNNWTVWITQNVLLAGLTQPIAADRRAALVRRAVRSLHAFLSDYGEDGACEEGAMYYRHAGLCLWGALDLLERVMPQQVEPVWRLPKIRNIADYIEAVHVGGHRYINFADCPAVTARCSLREVLFGRAVGSTRLEAFATRNAGAEGWDDLPDEINLWYRLLQARHAGAVIGPPPPAPPPRDVWYPSIGLMVARDDRFTLAVKAGDNGDSHNHNDVGSVTLYKNGQPVLIDLGVETYTARTFSSRRYEIWTMQSSWHNLPSFGGVGQAPGDAFAACDVAASLTEGQARLDMDITAAWPPEAGLRAARRRVTLHKGVGVEIEDSYDGDLPAELTLLFSAEPRVTGQGLELPGLADLRLEGLSDLRISAVPVTDPRLARSWPNGIWRVLCAVPTGQLKVTIN